MSSMSDFIIENGVLMEYVGPGGDVVIPEGVTTIKGWPRFMGYMNPFALTLANSVVSCDVEDLLAENITALTIPAGTEFRPGSFGPNYMSFFRELREINVDSENPHCASKDGILYSKDMTILYACPAAREGAVEIPDTVTTIAERAFDGCRLLREIVIPDSVKSIERRAFMDCKTLAKVVLPAGCAMGEEVFLRCAKLTNAGLKGTGTGKSWSLEFPWTEEIPANAFAGMNKLKKVVLPDTVRVIGKNAFKGCKALEEINLPEGVKVDKKAFKDCKNLSV